MLERPEYLFLVALHENAVAGFSITLCFASSDACLLEYLAVAASRRAQGIGRRLFTEAAKHSQQSGRFLLAEVDSDNAANTADAEQRKAFYRRLGCREVEGLRYIMPPVASARPPEMNLFAHRQSLPPSIDKAHLRIWLQCIYAEIYGQTPDDPRLEHMLEGLPDNIRLI